MAKVLELQPQHQFLQWIFQIDFLLDGLVQSCNPRDSQESSPTPQLKSINFWHSAFFMVQLSHPYMATGKTTALTIWNFVSRKQIEKDVAVVYVKECSVTFFSKSFIVSGLTFRSLIHFEFIFVYGVKECLNLIFFNIQLASTIYCRDCLFSIAWSCLLCQTLIDSNSGHSCPVPDLRGNVFSFSQFSMMLTVGLSYLAFIMLR